MSNPLWRRNPDLYVRCFNCDGEGRVKCRTCDGKGHVYGLKFSLWGRRVSRDGLGYKTCRTCNGSGGRRCAFCLLGSIRRTRAVEVEKVINPFASPSAPSLSNPFADFRAGETMTLPNALSVASPVHAQTSAAIPQPRMTPPCRPAPQRLKAAHLVARVNRYYSRLGVAGLDVIDTFRIGDVVHVWNAGTDFVQKVTSIQHEKQSIDEAEPGWQIGMTVTAEVHLGDEVYVVRPQERERTLGIGSQPGETLIGEVQHYYGRIGVATVVLTGQLSLADHARFRGRSTNFIDTVLSIQRDGASVKRSPAGSVVGVRVAQRVHEHDLVYRLRKSQTPAD